MNLTNTSWYWGLGQILGTMSDMEQILMTWVTYRWLGRANIGDSTDSLEWDGHWWRRQILMMGTNTTGPTDTRDWTGTDDRQILITGININDFHWLVRYSRLCQVLMTRNEVGYWWLRLILMAGADTITDTDDCEILALVTAGPILETGQVPMTDRS